MMETSKIGLLGIKETQSFVREGNTFSSGTFSESLRQQFKLLIFYIMIFLVARDRNLTQTRLNTKGTYWLI